MGTLAPETILHQLADLWVSQGKEGHAESGAGVLRACSMTLVVVSEAGDDASALGETLAALMPEHPARTILIRVSGAGPAALEERVYAQCWMPFGQRRQICCEQVEITATDAALLEVPSVVLPLAVADLPLILWCRSARVFAMPEFDAMASMAHKVIIDSAAVPGDARAALARLRQAAGRMLGDLAWTRLTRWREMLSHVFENREIVSDARNVSRVTVEYPGAAPNSSSLYMGAWVMGCLTAAGAEPQLTLAGGEWTGSEPAPLVMRVVLEGEGIFVELMRWTDRMVTTVNNLAQCTHLPLVTEYAQVREELGIVRRDPVFEKALASAVGVAYPSQ
ncbi:MAG: glucose-6-phosphate dehydrogenase assembly protein OpcA [Candidatus Sulfopaludibacter sp.]|nr:glucose-6-phosphate dehydrogenase assembly protein OpcA [Candidatus Sulfopaludibacter sp.]